MWSGAIEASFNAAFGSGSFKRWLSAFEEREFELCKEITGRSDGDALSIGELG